MNPQNTPHSAAPVQYRVELHDLHAHLFRVVLSFVADSDRTLLSLPVWIPGSYLVREFSRNLQEMKARQGRKALSVQQIDKSTWSVQTTPGAAVEVSVDVAARDASVRTAWLDAERAFFNATSLCLRVQGQTERAHTLHIPKPAQACTQRWKLATGLQAIKADARGFGQYVAANYDELADAPVEMGDFWEATFEVLGVPHRFVVSGAPAAFDGQRLVQDTQAICEAEMRFWHGDLPVRAMRRALPFEGYTFLLHAVDDGYGGLEHRNSTALICTRRDLPRADTPTRNPGEGYTTLLGLISHEYFHTWNVKRLRPAEFAPYRYDQENYTELLWFFEGFTSYYDDLLLHRAGLIDEAHYLKLLGKGINQVLQTPGRLVQSVAKASFDAWIKYYRPDENTPNATVSYYSKGALVALCLDLTLRREGRTTLDAVMRALWTRTQGGPMTEQDLADVLQTLGQRSYAKEIKAWVHSTAELPLRELLQAHGVATHDDPAQLAQRLGLRVSEAQGLVVKTVLRGGAAEKAGMAPGDEWLGVRLPSDKAQAGGWRLNKLDDLLLYAGSARKLTALVSRDRRLLELPLVMPQGVTTWRLVTSDAKRLAAWLGG